MSHHVHAGNMRHNSSPALASSPLSGKLALCKFIEAYQCTAEGSLPVFALLMASVERCKLLVREPSEALFVKRHEMIAILSGGVEMDNATAPEHVFIHSSHDFSVPWALQVNASNMEVVWLST